MKVFDDVVVFCLWNPKRLDGISALPEFLKQLLPMQLGYQLVHGAMNYQDWALNFVCTVNVWKGVNEREGDVKFFKGYPNGGRNGGDEHESGDGFSGCEMYGWATANATAEYDNLVGADSTFVGEIVVRCVNVTATGPFGWFRLVSVPFCGIRGGNLLALLIMM